MSCDDARRLLSERLDQPLDPEQAARLRAHLAICAECRAFDRALSTGTAHLSLLPKSRESERVRQEVFRYVLLSESDPLRSGRRSWFRQLAGFSAAAIVVVALAAVLIVALQHQVDSGQPAQQATTERQLDAGSTSRTSAGTRKQPTAAGPTASAPSTYGTLGTSATTAATGSVTPSAAPLSSASAQQLVEEFYAEVNQRQYATAFGHFTEQMQATLHQDEASFAAGYATTTQSFLHVSDVQELTGDGAGQTTQYEVDVVVTAQHLDGSVTTYSGYYTVGTVDGQAKIVGADIRVEGKDRTAPPSSEPTATP